MTLVLIRNWEIDELRQAFGEDSIAGKSREELAAMWKEYQRVRAEGLDVRPELSKPLKKVRNA